MIRGRDSLATVPVGIVYPVMLPLAPRITGLPHSAVPYFFWSRLTTRRAHALLSRRHSLPAFPDYVETLVNFVAAHAEL